ncbi:MAG: GNAT family N-acetyltransferase [Thermoanaerobaculia bacterium]|nr:GNAT family N-acetyltransferase [Thermoanaerobaculia bacterium]
MSPSEGVLEIARERMSEAVDVLSEAFFDYPVMTFTVGQAEDFPSRLRQLVEFFAMSRVYRGDLTLGVEGPPGKLVAVASINRPGSSPTPEALIQHRERLWSALGDDARLRYDNYDRACAPFEIEAPHYHLGMIGNLKRVRGQGYGRRLLEAVQARSAEDPNSTGVSLSTELAGNVPLYQHFGYTITGQGELAPGVPSWSFFRPDDPSP